jgi:hypothetical protein
MEWRSSVVAAFLAVMMSTVGAADQIPERHIQLARHEFMARSGAGGIIAIRRSGPTGGEFAPVEAEVDNK